MNTLIVILLVLAGAAALAAFWVVGLYNGLVTLRNRYKNGFSQIDVQLKRRYDLIPNLVETAKTYMAHEKDTLEAVIQARNQASAARQTAATAPADSSALKSLNQAEAGLTAAMSRFSIVQEGYPDLKANQNMMQLTEELTSTENKIAFARQAYNDAVMNYNNRREMFPSSFLAGMFNFTDAQLFEVTKDAERDPVKVQF
ncbi:MAG: LemA family protein [Verrucomicrobiota bacterium]